MIRIFISELNLILMGTSNLEQNSSSASVNVDTSRRVVFLYSHRLMHARYILSILLTGLNKHFMYCSEVEKS